MSPFVVYADDYTYIPINDIEQYNAYRFFELYGYKLDYTNTISYSQNYTGSYTYSGTISGSINGGFSGSFNVEITGLTKSNDGEGENSSPGIVTSSALMQASNFEMRLVPEDPTNQYTQAPFTCAATNNHQWTNGDNEYDTFACSYTTGGTTSFGGYEAPTYTVEFASPLTTGLQEIGTIEMTLVSVEQGSGGLNGSISLNESESSTGSGNISLSGSTSTTGHKTYNIPMLQLNSLNNNINYYRHFICNNNNPFVIAYLSYGQNANRNDVFDMYDENNNLINNGYSNISNLYEHTGYYFHVFEFTGNNTTNGKYVKFNKEVLNLLPIYVGNKNSMSDELYRYIYGSDRTDELLENGNSNSQQAINNNNTLTNSFSQASNSMHNIETTWENNLDNNLQNVPTNSDMYSNNKFIATANWVRIQFERIVLNTPFELLLVFSLILGIALVLIGKVR